MDQHLLAQLSGELKVAPLNIVREEAELLILNLIARSPLAAKLIFYGGTALRLAYNCPRFSEDLDFLQTGKIKEAELEKLLKEATLLEPTLNLEDIKEKYHTLFALIKIRSPYLKHPLSVKLEMSKRKNGIKKEFRPLASPCSNLQPTLYVATLESLELAKQRAVKGRNLARDWFDLWYITKIIKKDWEPPKPFHFNKVEFKRELKRFVPRNQWKLIDESLRSFSQ